MVEFEGSLETFINLVAQDHYINEILEEDVSTYDVDYNLPTQIYFINEYGVMIANYAPERKHGYIMKSKKGSCWSKSRRKFTKHKIVREKRNVRK